MSHSAPIVHIVGAGLSGLTLAQGLKRAGIPFVLYDKTSSFARHSYGITLQPQTYKPLSKLLLIDETVLRNTLAVDAAVGGTGVEHPKVETEKSFIRGLPFRANRAKLEAFLRKDIDVQINKDVTNIKFDQSKKPRLEFSDGRHAVCDVVVAADGIHSKIRRTLLADSTPTVLPYVVFNGKRRIDAAEYATMYAPHFRGATMLETQCGDYLLLISINEHEKDIVSLSYTISRPAEEQDKIHKPNRPTSGATDIPEEFYTELSNLPLLSPPFSDMFDPEKVRKDRLLNWLMRTSYVAPSDMTMLASKCVMMIGDAAHGQPILGGNGANQAIRDGIKLTNFFGRYGLRSFEKFSETKEAQYKSVVDSSVLRLQAMHSHALQDDTTSSPKSQL